MACSDHLPAPLQSYTPPQPLALANGMRMSGATVAYQTWGTLNAARDNVIWVCHALTASSDVAAWWPGAFGPGRVLDPERYYIVCANVLGSCYGSAGPTSVNAETGQRWGGDFPKISVADMVDHQRLLADHLGLHTIQLVIGASMGGFQVLEWARRDPARVQRIALIATSWRQPPQALAQAQLQCEFIRRDPRFAGGHYPADAGPEEGLALARQLGHLTYRSADELDRRFGRERREDGHYQVLSYLDHQGRKLVRRFDANAYLRLTEAMIAYDAAEGAAPELALATLRQPALVISLDSDQLYYPSEQSRLAQALPNGRLVQIETAYGHDGFLVDAAKIDPLLCAFRDEALPPAALASARPQLSQRRPRVPAVLIGATGRVGADLLALWSQPGSELPLQLVGVANSRAGLWQADGLAPGLAAERLRGASGGSAETLIEQLIALRRPAVLIDCTASERVAAHSARLLAAGIALVTPNKIAFAAESARWRPLQAALASGTPAGWSATVGAGLPILSTLRRLRSAGDQLHSVEASLSGTLGHVLTRTQDGATLRQAIGEAVAQGLAEPDPRIDLSGGDVRRKLLILLREAGVDLDERQIALDPLLRLSPTVPWEDAVAAHERDWLQLVDDARRAGQRLVYRARWRLDGGAEIGPALVPADHPLAGARGTENRVVLHTRYYGEQALLIAGAGAGVRITAAAVLADLKAIADILLSRSSTPTPLESPAPRSLKARACG